LKGSPKILKGFQAEKFEKPAKKPSTLLYVMNLSPSAGKSL